jgi:hypothetical protein
MNAKEAREKTIENIQSSTNEFILKIDAKIENAIKNKKLSANIFSIPKDLDELTILKNLYEGKGFVWKIHTAVDQRDDNSLILSW